MPLLSCKLTGLLRLSDSRLAENETITKLKFIFIVRLVFIFVCFFGSRVYRSKKILCGIADK